MTILNGVIQTMGFMFWVIVIGLAFCGFMIIRNNFVFDAKIDAIWSWPKGWYDKLPSYEAMLHHPRYYLIWTKSQWKAWVAKRVESTTG